MSASSNTPSGDPEPVDAEFEPADPQSDPEPSTAKPKTGGLGLGGALVVLLLAGVISAGVSYGVTRYVPLEGAAPDYTDENALAAIRDIIANNGPVTDFDASELEAQLSAHAADIAELQAMSEAVANLDAQIASLRVSQSSEEGAPSAQPSFDPQALASLSQDIQDVRTQLEQNTAADQQRLAELQGVITRVSTLSNNQQADDVSDRVSSLADQLTSLRSDIDRQSNDIQNLQTRDIPHFDPSPLQVRLNTLSNSLAEAQNEIETLRAQTQSASVHNVASRALALAALRDAAARSTPFEAERAALARVWRGHASLEALAEHARSGVPSQIDLSRSFPAEEIRNAHGARTLLFGWIKTRPSDEDRSEGVAALTQQIETRLTETDLAGAVDLAGRLDGDSATAVQSWLISAQARLRVDGHLDQLRRDLTTQSAQQGIDPS